MYNYCIMERFYWIVILIALLALLGILTYVGILMTYYRDKDTTYPPVAATCPDFWMVSDENPNKCKVPAGNDSAVNTGGVYTKNEQDPDNVTYDSQLNTTTTFGLDAHNNTIDFAHTDWGMGGTSTCKKQAWANQYGLVWDGVTNFNGC